MRTLSSSLPPRAHYCRTSKAMIKRMDHFCMFTNGCVGHANQHYFICFLAFLSAAGSHRGPNGQEAGAQEAQARDPDRRLLVGEGALLHFGSGSGLCLGPPSRLMSAGR